MPLAGVPTGTKVEARKPERSIILLCHSHRGSIHHLSIFLLFCLLTPGGQARYGDDEDADEDEDDDDDEDDDNDQVEKKTYARLHVRIWATCESESHTDPAYNDLQSTLKHSENYLMADLSFLTTTLSLQYGSPTPTRG